MNYLLNRVCHYSIYNVRQVTKGYFATLYVTSQVTKVYAATVLKTVFDVYRTTVTETRANFNFVTNKL